MEITQNTIDKIDEVLSRGLCKGTGSRDGQMCVEAAICYALDLPHGDNPKCVTEAVRGYKIRLNDSPHWESPESRAAGLRSLAIAQLGSKGVVDGEQFYKLLAEKTVRVLLPKLFRELFPDDKKLLAAADRCEREGTATAAHAARNAARAADAAYAATCAHYAAYAADAVYAADAAHYAAYAAGESYLILSAELALETLQELGSPGCEWL